MIIYLAHCNCQRNLIPQAIHQIIEKHFVRNSISFDFIFNSNDSKLIDKTLTLIKDLKASRVVRVIESETNAYNLDHSGVFIFDKLKSYQKFEPRMNSVKNGPKAINLMIYCVDAMESLIKKSLMQDELQIRSFLVVSRTKIDLLATTLFTPEQCHRQQLIRINEFSKKSLTWTTNKFAMSSIKDFHRCSLNIAVASRVRPSSICDLVSKKLQCSGYHLNLVNVLARVLNFEPKYSAFFQGIGYQDNEGTQTTKHHWTLVTIPINNHYYFEYDLSSPILTSKIVIAVPPGERFSSIDKLFLPFDGTTWILFLLLFAVAFTTTFLISCTRSTSLKSVFAGPNVKSLALNVFGAYMGLAQPILPVKNFARILLMNLIIFSLIMRTAHQGKYFEFLTTNPLKRRIQTIDELVENKFKVFYAYTLDDFFKNILKNDRTKRLKLFESSVIKFHNSFGFRLNLVEVSSLEMQTKILSSIQDSAFRGSIVDYQSHMLYDDRRLFSTTEWNFLDETIESSNMAITLQRLSFLYPAFNKKIIQLNAGGFFNQWINYIDWRLFNVKKIAALMNKPTESDKIVLTLTELSVGFVIWLLMLFVSFLGFVGELSVFWTRSVLRKLFFQYAIRKFGQYHKEALVWF